MAKFFNDDVFKILESSAIVSRNFGHTWSGTPHLLFSLINFLNTHNGESDEYEKFQTTIKEIFNKNELDGKKLKEAFLELYPAKPLASSVITIDKELERVKDSLKRTAFDKRSSATIADLIYTLFSDKSFAIYTIISKATGSDQNADQIFEAIQSNFSPAKDIVKNIALEQLDEIVNLNKYVKDHPQTILNADKTIQKIEIVLNSRLVPNVALVGLAGVGKTSYVYELAQRINSGNVSENMKDKTIYELDLTALEANTRYRGEFEAKILRIVEIVKEDPNAIIFIDEGHRIVDAGGNSGDANNLGNILKPYISRGELKLIIATTSQEYSKFIENDKAFARRFTKVNIAEPSKEQTVEILKGVKPIEEEFYKKILGEGLEEKIVDLSAQYSLDQANPAKSLNLMDVAFAFVKTLNTSETVLVDDVIEAVKLKYDIFISKNRLKDTKSELFNIILGQDEALTRISRNLSIVDKGILNPDRPAYSMILGGPTGVGKTETAKIIAEKFFGNRKNNLIKVSCSELSDGMSVSKLVGSAPGYVGLTY